MEFQLAWRNIWRNPRRTLVIMCAVIIGVWSMIFLGAVMQGMAVDMVNNSIATLTGNVQIHHKNYQSDPVVENSITGIGSLASTLNQHLPPGAKWASRVRVNVIAQNARHTNGVTLVGIEPLKEAEISFIGQALIDGRYLEPGDRHGIIVGEALLEQYETKLGHKLILTSQDTDQEMVSRAFRIVGTFRAQMQETEKQFVFVSLGAAQKMLKLNDRVSEVSIVLADHRNSAKVSENLKKILSGTSFEVKTWKELLPVLMAYLQIFNGFVFVWYLVVFVAMGSGIVNTMLMAIFERMREFGLVKALGMKSSRIVKEVLIESFLLLLIGTLVGNLLGILCILAFSQNGIDLTVFAAGAEYIGISRVVYPALRAGDLIIANVVVFVLGLLISLYPALKAAKFTPVEALGHT